MLALGAGQSKFIGPIVAASPTSFVVFLVLATVTTKSDAALKISCEVSAAASALFRHSVSCCPSPRRAFMRRFFLDLRGRLDVYASPEAS